MPLATLVAGLRHSASLVVDDTLTVPAVSRAFTGFETMPPVFATAYLVGFVEWACLQLLAPHLAPGEMTLGTHVDLSHSAATPVGLRISADVELLQIDGRRLVFGAVCRDERDEIGRGRHERALVVRERFLSGVQRKLEGRRS